MKICKKQMKPLKYIVLFLLPFFFFSCEEKEEPYADLFSIAVDLDEQGGEVKVIKHECEVTINGEQQYIHVTLSGDFDKLDLLQPYSTHEWSMVTFGEKDLSILVLKNGTGVVRKDYVDFAVSKGSVRNEGTVSIVQLPGL